MWWRWARWPRPWPQARACQLPEGRRARSRAAVLAAQPDQGRSRQRGTDLPGRSPDPAIAADGRLRRRGHPGTHRHHRPDPRPGIPRGGARFAAVPETAWRRAAGAREAARRPPR
ncbi:hypothetical protein G6F65_022094 [Rhizopus arrhizus]|nr:hypothetical protein G6F65_022094 [Rhizopus arrhizus]